MLLAISCEQFDMPPQRNKYNIPTMQNGKKIVFKIQAEDNGFLRKNLYSKENNTKGNNNTSEDSFMSIEEEYIIKKMMNLYLFCVFKKSKKLHIDNAQNKLRLLSERALFAIAIIKGETDTNNVNKYAISLEKNFLE